MNASNSKRIPIWKLFGKLRSFIVVQPDPNAPHRSWDRAASREIQLEFDFERRGRMGVKGAVISAVCRHNKRGDEVERSWRRNSIN